MTLSLSTIASLTITLSLSHHNRKPRHHPTSSRRSASGMKKNVYGNIEDIIVDFALVTPIGACSCVGHFHWLELGVATSRYK